MEKEYLLWKGFDRAFLELLSLHVDGHLLFLKDQIREVDEKVAQEIAEGMMQSAVELYKTFGKFESEEQVRREVLNAVLRYLGLK